MDLNITTYNIDSNQENLLLLNAIKNKFHNRAANEAGSFSPPKFNIPLLKIPESASLRKDVDHKNTDQANSADNKLNQFLWKQLQEKHDISTDHAGFVLPKLQCSSNSISAGKFHLPVLNSQSPSTNVGCLTKAINKLQVQENSCETNVIKSVPPATVAIDLTAALAVKFETHQGTPSTRNLSKPPRNDLDFEIPFVDCDREDASRKRKNLLPASNDYCITDVSELSLQHSVKEPSAIGRILSIDDMYSTPIRLKILAPHDYRQKPKHSIEPFHFDTKSPDDLVLLTLNKYHRRHFN